MLRIVLGYVNADRVESACVCAPVRRDSVDDDGLVREPGVRAVIRDAVRALAEHAIARTRSQS
jgi:hypothetical protein